VSELPIYDISAEEQLKRWAEGESVHRRIETDGAIMMLDGNYYECCPDFSCCRPELLQPLEIRQRFIQASEEERHEYLMTFLQTFVGSTAYVID
jgi:hypothetical protein